MVLRRIEKEKYLNVQSEEVRLGVGHFLTHIQDSLKDYFGGFCESSYGRKIYGKEGLYIRSWSATIPSTPGLEMHVVGHFMDSGFKFTGKIELTLTYLEGIDKEDLNLIRKAIEESGLKKE